MAEIIRVFRENAPAMRFIGKKYASFGHWGEWFANGWFDEIERAMGGAGVMTGIWENGGGYVGLERRKAGEAFEYWIGMFVPLGTAVPDNFLSQDFAEPHIATCWIYGGEAQVHNTGGCDAAVRSAGFEPAAAADGATYAFENCLCPRFTTPDEKGNVILDYCIFVK